jgi:hypothetical protein
MLGREAPRTSNDVDGDGRPEIWFEGYVSDYSGVEGCYGYVFNVPESGTITPASSDVWVGVPAFDVVGDQSGDDVVDVWVAQEGVVKHGPLVFEDGAISGVGEQSIGYEFGVVLPQAVDVNGDGFSEFIGITWGPEEVLMFDEAVEGASYAGIESVAFLVYGGELMEASTYEAGWDMTGLVFSNYSRSFSEDGFMTMPIRDSASGVVHLVDLGGPSN